MNAVFELNLNQMKKSWKLQLNLKFYIKTIQTSAFVHRFDNPIISNMTMDETIVHLLLLTPLFTIRRKGRTFSPLRFAILRKRMHNMIILMTIVIKLSLFIPLPAERNRMQILVSPQDRGLGINGIGVSEDGLQGRLFVPRVEGFRIVLGVLVEVGDAPELVRFHLPSGDRCSEVARLLLLVVGVPQCSVYFFRVCRTDQPIIRCDFWSRWSHALDHSVLVDCA